MLTVLLLAASYGEAHPTKPGTYFTGGHHLPHTPNAALVLVVVAGMALAWRNRYPLAVLGVSTAAVSVYSLLGYVNGASLLLPAVALGSVATIMPIRRSAGWALLTTVVLMSATAANNPFGSTNGGFILIPADIAVALFAGIAIGNRRAYIDALRDRAERDARRQVDEERLRIARELHDVVAHTMATINVQAGAAAALLRDRPDQAAESLTAIRAASKDGLRELRAILNVLRHVDEPADPTRPAPGLARLDALAAGVRAAGLPVTMTVAGHRRDLPAVTDLAAFRIIQEALTNAIRHAGPATAEVSVRYGDSDLQIEVTDTGQGMPASIGEMTFASLLGCGASATDGIGGTEPGHGLRGMRERAAAADGTLEIESPPSGGFRVAARFPLDSAHLTTVARPAAPASPSDPQEASL
jgi:signal transduction histidine kinase